MAQWNKNSQDLAFNHTKTLYEVQMQADQYGNIINEGATARSVFGEAIAVPVTPVLQLDGLYDLDPQQFETFQVGGTAGTSDTLMRVTTGTGQFGYGVLRSRRAVRYRPGQGAVARFTAKFTESAPGVGVDGYTQRAGFFTQEQAVQIGFNGTEFGVLRENGGKAHIEILTITAPAGASSDIIITYPTQGASTSTETIAVSNGDTVQEVAQKIALVFAGNPFYIIETYDDKVCFLARSVGAKGSAFNYDAGTTQTTATSVNIQVGVAHTSLWTPQADFNFDTLDGNGPSKVTIDPTKLNVFQINFRWLGAGEIRYAIENPINGDMIYFHHEHYSNRNEDVHIDNPSLKIGYVAASLGGTGTDVVVEGASMMGAIEGVITNTKFPTATFADTGAGQNLSANVWHHALTIKNNVVFKDKINTREVLIKNLNSAFTTGGSAPVAVGLILNPSSVATTRDYTSINTWSSVSRSNTTSTVDLTADRLLYLLDVGTAGASVDLNELRIAIPPNNELSMVIRSTAIISRSAVSMSWVED